MNEDLKKKIDGLEQKITEMQETILAHIQDKKVQNSIHLNIANVSIETLQLEELAYHLDKIDVKELSGMLNLGNTFSPALEKEKKNSKSFPKEEKADKKKKEESDKTEKQPKEEEVQHPNKSSDKQKDEEAENHDKTDELKKEEAADKLEKQKKEEIKNPDKNGTPKEEKPDDTDKPFDHEQNTPSAIKIVINRQELDYQITKRRKT